MTRISYLLLLVVGSEEELGAVTGVEPEDELSLGVVTGQLHARLVNHHGRTRSFRLEKVLLVSEEAHQLAAQDSVVRLPGSIN